MAIKNKGIKSNNSHSFDTAIAITAILLIWYIISAVANIAFLPSPISVLENIFYKFTDDLWLHAVYSLSRIILGISISLVLGLGIGLSMGYYPWWDRAFSSFVYLLYPVPKIALLPLVMMVCGIGETAKITMLVLIIVFQIIVASRDSVKTIPQEVYYSLKVLGAKDITIFRRVVFPATLPSIFSAIRISLGTALSVLFFTETFGTTYGMGYYIMNSWTRVNYVDMFSGIVVLGIMGFILFYVVDILLKYCCPWKTQS